MNIVAIEGPDNTGKTTLIQHLINNEGFTLLEFPKKTSDGLFTIATRNEVAIFDTMLNHLDPSKKYILDRCFLSNMVYYIYRKHHGKSFVIKETQETFNNYVMDLINLKNKCLVIGLTRNKINSDFEDDLIKLSKEQFNDIITVYDMFYEEFGIRNFKLLEHDSNNNVLSGYSYADVTNYINTKLGQL
ncbi:hypothetical protein vBSdyM006_033 [Shigella phage vB_SdyM_006]|nr:hypothetical protein vBSdyM006_033 [Shigella phage vB_SdyM_006]